MAKDGRKQRAKSEKGRLRRPNLNAVYTKRIRAISPGQYEFRITLIRPEQPKEKRATPLSRNSIDLSWNEEGDALSGSLTLKRSRADDWDSVPIARGHAIRLMVKIGSRWHRLWDMKVMAIPEVDGGTGDVTCDLGDSLYPMKRTKRDWKFRKTKSGAKREGWTCDEIARYVCRKIGVRPGKLAKGTTRFELKDLKEKDGLDVIRQAYAKEKEESGRKFNIRLRNGRFEALPFKRPGTVFVIKGIELSKSFSGEAKKDTPVTEIEGKGRLKGETGKDSKLEITVSRRGAMRRFGKVTDERSYGKVRSKEHLRTLIKRDLAKELKVTRSAQITLPGIPFMEKGSALKWIVKEPGWYGMTKMTKRPRDKAFCYVTTASHSLTSTSYTTSISVDQEDVYFTDAQRLDEEKRDKKRKERDGRREKRNNGGDNQ